MSDARGIAAGRFARGEITAEQLRSINEELDRVEGKSAAPPKTPAKRPAGWLTLGGIFIACYVTVAAVANIIADSQSEQAGYTKIAGESAGVRSGEGEKDQCTQTEFQRALGIPCDEEERERNARDYYERSEQMERQDAEFRSRQFNDCLAAGRC